jgi:hypothetical protein
LFHELGLGRNFTDWTQARPGDFMKIFWNEHIGRGESGHSVVYLGRCLEDGVRMVRYWSSNQGKGYGFAQVPEDRVKRAIFSRLTSPEAIARAVDLPATERYLGSLLTYASSETEMLPLIGLGSDGLPASAKGAPLPGAPLAAETDRSSPGADPVDALFQGSAYATYPRASRIEILRLVQARLRYDGLYVGQPDGSPGPLTSAAIRAWQGRHSLVGNGTLDDPTLRSLGLPGLPQASIPEIQRTQVDEVFRP